MKTVAILRKEEFESDHIKHGVHYSYRYDENNDDFFIVIDGKDYPEVSTAFDFVNVFQ